MAVATVWVSIHGKKVAMSYDPATGVAQAVTDAPLLSSGYRHAGQGPGVAEIAKETGGYYPITISAVDEAGNKVCVHHDDAALGPSLRLYVRETDAPGALISIPEGVIRSKNVTVSILVSDDGSGIDVDTLRISLNDNPLTADLTTADEINYASELKLDLTDGEYTLRLEISDYDGNTSTEISEFEVDAFHSVQYLSNDAAYAEETIAHGESAPPLTPAVPGYVFKGWYLNGVLYDFSLPVLEDLILVARWQISDNCRLIADLLMEEWQQYIVKLPNIYYDGSVHTVDARYTLLEIRQLNDLVTPAGIGYITQDRAVHITITLRGSFRDLVTAQAQEALRCLQARRRNPGGGYSVLIPEGIKDVQIEHMSTRFTLDCTLHAYAEIID